MSDAHSRGVTRHRLYGENMLDDGYWDDVFTEEVYFENDSAPVGPSPDDRGRVKGEFDFIAVNYDNRDAYVVEVKSNTRDLGKAGRQLERAKKHFEPEWSLYCKKWLEE